jgi:cell division protein FtsB
MRRGFLQTILRSFMFTAILAYFLFHALHGEQGLYAMIMENRKQELLKEELARTRAERQRLEHRVSLMRSDSLDPDLLDEQVRRNLGLIGENEIMVHIK